MSFVFGGSGNPTYEELQQRRKVAEAMQQRSGTPRNVGEGLDRASSQILGAIMQRKADKGLAGMRDEFTQQYEQMVPAEMRDRADMLNNPAASDGQRRVLEAMMKGVPGFRRGTNFAPGGQAIVGEDGPEVVNLPRGSQVIPNPNTQMQMAQMEPFYPGGPSSEADMGGSGGYFDPPEPDDFLRGEMGDDAFQQYQGMSREQRLDFMNNPQNGFVPPAPGDMRENLGYDAQLQGLQPTQNSFQPGAEYQTADMSGIEPSGTGERNQLNSAARSYQGLMKSLQDYEAMFANGGSTAWPGQRKDELATAHRDLQMQMKELYNLGVLNGPDLMLMDQILLDPTSVMGNVKDALGIADMEKRIPANIQEVRRMMTNRTTPALQQLGIDPKSLMPADEMSDEDYLKSLGLE